MARYLAVRLLHAAVTVWAAFTLSFLMLYLLPGDPVTIMLDGEGGASSVSPAQVAALRSAYGFDKPVLTQYLDRLWAALHGDFGTSLETGDTVLHTFAVALPQTLALAGAGLLLASVLGLGTALVATATRSRRLSRLLLAAPSLGVSLPQFAVGLVLLQLLSFQWRLLPAFGDPDGVGLILPALTLALPTASVLAQVFAQSLADALEEPYVTTARAKGAGRARVQLRHAARNAALPLLSLGGLVAGNLLAGSVVVETVFSRDGFGQITAAAVASKDIPVVQGAVVIGALVFATVSLAVDLVNPLLDPRLARTGAVRAGQGRSSRRWLRPRST
jgi:peptide/nickel transport system permease protein